MRITPANVAHSVETAQLPSCSAHPVRSAFVGLESITRPGSPASRAQLPPLALDPLPAARAHFEQFPELGFFQGPDVAATQEGTVSSQSREDSYCLQMDLSYSEELERSLQSLHCLDLLLDGSATSYGQFTAAQAEPRLSVEHYDQLSSRLHRLLGQFKQLIPKQVLETLRAGLVLGDIGKSPKARLQMRELGIGQPDHDDFYAAVLQHETAAETLPSFRSLNALQKQLLRETCGLAHFGHLAHCEGGPSMYQPLRMSGIVGQATHLLDFALLLHTCDVAGALGHTSNKGSRTLNDETFCALEATRSACLLLADHDEMAAYRYYLLQRAGGLGLSSEAPATPWTMLLARLGASLRLFNEAAGSRLQMAFLTLDADNRWLAQQMLGPEGAVLLPRTPTYAPAVLVNLINNPDLGSTPQTRTNAALQIGLPFLATTLKLYREQLTRQEISRDIALNFNGAAALARDEPARLRGRISINKITGAVLLS